jgi:hypothetical protein
VVSIVPEALLAMFPNIVLSPVSITSAFALPLTILVPSQREFVLFDSSVCSSNTPASFLTGKDSPVKLDSFACSSLASISKQSAGIISPALKRSTSPATI